MFYILSGVEYARRGSVGGLRFSNISLALRIALVSFFVCFEDRRVDASTVMLLQHRMLYDLWKACFTLFAFLHSVSAFKSHWKWNSVEIALQSVCSFLNVLRISIKFGDYFSIINIFCYCFYLIFQKFSVVAHILQYVLLKMARELFFFSCSRLVLIYSTVFFFLILGFFLFFSLLFYVYISGQNKNNNTNFISAYINNSTTQFNFLNHIACSALCLNKKMFLANYPLLKQN